MALSTINRAVLRQRLAGDWGLRGLRTGTAADDGSTTLQSATSLVDATNGTGLKDTAFTSGRYNNAILGIWGGTTSTAYEWANIPNGGYSPSQGQITVGRTFSTTPVTALTPYEIHTHGYNPDELNAALRWSCRNLERPNYKALCGLLEAYDGDMEASGVTNWTGTTCTVTKVTAAGNVARGEQSLSCLNTATNGYAASAAIPVRSSRVFTVMALCRSTTGIASLVVRDRTNAANITVNWQQISNVDATVATDWEFLAGTFTTPSTCVSIELRLSNDNVAGQSYWDDVCLYRADDLALDLPSWIADPLGQILDVYTWQGTYVTLEARELVKLRPLKRPFGNPTGVTPWRLPVPGLVVGGQYFGGAGALNRPVVILAAQPLPDLTTEAGTIPDVYQEQVLAGALYALFNLGSRPRGLDVAEFNANRERSYADWTRISAANNAASRMSRPVWSQ